MKYVARLITLLIMSAIMLTSCGVKSNVFNDRNGGMRSSGNTEEPVELTMVYYSSGPIPEDLQKVQDEFNRKIAIPKMNARVKLQPIKVASWQQKTNIMLSGGFPMDLMICFETSAYKYASQGQALPITRELDRYGKDIKRLIDSSLWQSCTYNGEIICVPNLGRSMGKMSSIVVRSDLMEKHGLKAEEMKTANGIEKALKVIKEKEPDIIPLLAFRNVATHIPVAPDGGRIFTRPGDAQGFAAIAEEIFPIKAVNFFETPEYKMQLEYARRWYLSGYLDKYNSYMSTEDTLNVFKAGRAFSYMDYWIPEYDNTKDLKYGGHKVQYITLDTGYSSAGDVQAFSWIVPSTSTHPDKAVQLLNLIYTDHEATNLLAWGIEGIHYVKTGKDAKEIEYLNGVTADTVTYKNNIGYAFGGIFNSYYMKGTDPNIGQRVQEFNNTIPKSSIMGFAFDFEPIKTEYAAITDVKNQYYLLLSNGNVDPASLLPKFLEELKAAGSERVVAELQRQIDVWAAKGKR